MQQRQLRLGDILDDYCPRERRLSNHAVVAMVGPDVKQTRCTTCEAEHEYKHAKIPRQRRKSESPPALYSQVLAGGPKRVAHEAAARDASPSDTTSSSDDGEPAVPKTVEPDASGAAAASAKGEELPNESSAEAEHGEPADEPEIEEGPVHRPLIRATLPRPEGQPPPTRPSPDFTMRQPGGRPNRFRPRHQRGGQQFHPNRGNGSMGGPMRSGGAHRQGGRPPHVTTLSRHGRRHGPGRKRSK